MANFFPRWTNWVPIKALVCGIVLVCGVSGATWYYATPKYTKVGYQPIQPVPFPHDIHVTQLGMDCRYCHSFVEVAAQSNVPNTATCMNCHRHPENYLRPDDQVFNLDWKPEDVKPVEFVTKYGQPSDTREDFSKKKQLTQSEIGQTLKERWKITPPTNCQGCHR